MVSPTPRGNQAADAASENLQSRRRALPKMSAIRFAQLKVRSCHMPFSEICKISQVPQTFWSSICSLPDGQFSGIHVRSQSLGPSLGDHSRTSGAAEENHHETPSCRGCGFGPCGGGGSLAIGSAGISGGASLTCSSAGGGAASRGGASGGSRTAVAVEVS